MTSLITFLKFLALCGRSQHHSIHGSDAVRVSTRCLADDGRDGEKRFIFQLELYEHRLDHVLRLQLYVVAKFQLDLLLHPPGVQG